MRASTTTQAPRLGALLLCASLAVGCAADDRQFTFAVSVTRDASAEIVVDGDPAFTSRQWTFSDYDAAQASLHVPVVVTSTTGGELVTEIAPGYCAGVLALPPYSGDPTAWGELETEEVTLAAGADLHLYPVAWRCQGTQSEFAGGP